MEPIVSDITIKRVWAMPNKYTFDLPPVRELLTRIISQCKVIIDPFSRNATWGTITNDLDVSSCAHHHMDAVEFCDMLLSNGVQADGLLFDPPYSPRQMSEAYKNAGLPVGMKGTQNATLYAAVRDRLTKIAVPGAVAVSCGWNSQGFGMSRGWKLQEVLLVPHGGAHNDTIVTVEVKEPSMGAYRE